MKHLPKHLQPRYRYLAVAIEAWPDVAIDRQAFQRAVWEETRGLLGDAGSATVDPTVVEFSFADGEGEAIVRVRRGETEDARAAIACIEAIDGAAVGLRIPGKSGTIRACEEKYMGGRREPVREKTVVFGNAERTAVVRSDRVNVRIDGAFAGATDFDIEG